MSNKNFLMNKIKATTNKSIDKGAVDELKAKESFTLQFIEVDKIKRNENNFYEIVDIEQLANDIAENGLEHNLVVNKIADDEYELISGERRLTAIKSLLEKDEKAYENFKKIPCKVVTCNAIDSQIRLIQANVLARELTEREKLIQVAQLRKLLEEKKKDGWKNISNINDIMCDILDFSPSQLNRYVSVSKAEDEVKEAYLNKELTMAEASEVSRLNASNQKIAMEIINNADEKIPVKDLKNDIKNEEEKIKKELEESGVSVEDNEEIVTKQVEENIKEKYLSSTINFYPKTTFIRDIKKINKNISKLADNIPNLNDISDDIINEFNNLKDILDNLKLQIETKKS